MANATTIKSSETIESVKIPVDSVTLDAGTLERVATLAAHWFERYLRAER